MDKYEYKLKTDQMLELMEDGSYRKAAEIGRSHGISYRQMSDILRTYYEEDPCQK